MYCDVVTLFRQCLLQHAIILLTWACVMRHPELRTCSATLQNTLRNEQSGREMRILFLGSEHSCIPVCDAVTDRQIAWHSARHASWDARRNSDQILGENVHSTENRSQILHGFLNMPTDLDTFQLSLNSNSTTRVNWTLCKVLQAGTKCKTSRIKLDSKGCLIILCYVILRYVILYYIVFCRPVQNLKHRE